MVSGMRPAVAMPRRYHSPTETGVAGFSTFAVVRALAAPEGHLLMLRMRVIEKQSLLDCPSLPGPNATPAPVALLWHYLTADSSNENEVAPRDQPAPYRLTLSGCSSTQSAEALDRHLVCCRHVSTST